MADFKIVSVRLKDDYEEIFKGIRIRNAEDASIFAKSICDWKPGEIFVINLNVKSNVISVFNGDSEHMKDNINEIVGRSILSNSAAAIVVSRGIDATNSEYRKFTRQLNLAYRFFGISFLDHVFERDEYTYDSYEIQGIDFEPIANNNPSLHTFGSLDVREESEFSKLRLVEEKSLFSNTEQEAISEIADELKYMDREAFYIISLDELGKPLNATISSIGTLDASPVSGREIFKVPLLSGAKQVIFMHNHPSVDITPSGADKNMTFHLTNAAGALGIEVKDSMIVAAKTGEIYSMRENEEFDFMAALSLRNAVRESLQVKENEDMQSRYANSSFKKEVQRVTEGTFGRYSALKVCDTPEILKAAGLDDYPMFMTQKHVKDILHEKSLNPHHHGLNIEQLSLLPEELKEPVAIYDSLSDDESVVCLTSQIDKDNLPIVVSIRPNGEGIYEMQKMSSNFITSMYGRANFENHFSDVIDSQSLIYINKEKSQELFRVLQLQLPQGVNNLNFDTIIHKSENAVNARESGYSLTQSKKQMEEVKEDDLTKQYENAKRKTIVVNAFGGPGAGKTTAAWHIAAELKKKGLVVEYVPEYAKELVWDENFKLLDGSKESQSHIFYEQKKRVDRLIGKVDVVVTDSPILLNTMYLKEPDQDYENSVLKAFSKYENFNFVVMRGNSFEQEGRIQNLEQSIEKDNEINQFLDKHDIYYGTYNHEKIDTLIDNICRYQKGLSSHEAKKENVKHKATREKTYININKKFVLRDLMDKNSGKSYNLVTIPPNTKAGDIDISGYHFYPLYVNQSPFKENMYTLPYEKDRNILLMKGNEKIIIKAGVLKEALNENYKQFVKDRQALNNLQKKQKDELEI